MALDQRRHAVSHHLCGHGDLQQRPKKSRFGSILLTDPNGPSDGPVGLKYQVGGAEHALSPPRHFTAIPSHPSPPPGSGLVQSWVHHHFGERSRAYPVHAPPGPLHGVIRLQARQRDVSAWPTSATLRSALVIRHA